MAEYFWKCIVVASSASPHAGQAHQTSSTVCIKFEGHNRRTNLVGDPGINLMSALMLDTLEALFGSSMCLRAE
jgi:hypothetical protein